MSVNCLVGERSRFRVGTGFYYFPLAGDIPSLLNEISKRELPFPFCLFCLPLELIIIAFFELKEKKNRIVLAFSYKRVIEKSMLEGNVLKACR